MYHDAETLAAGDDAEEIEEANEEHLARSWQSCAEIHQNGKDQTRHDLEGNFERDLLREESLDAVRAIVVLPVKDFLLAKVHSNVLQHANESESTEFVNETETCLHRFVLVAKWCEEERNIGETRDEGCAGDEERKLAPKVDEGTLDEDRVGREEGGRFANQRPQLCEGEDDTRLDNGSKVCGIGGGRAGISKGVEVRKEASLLASIK